MFTSIILGLTGLIAAGVGGLTSIIGGGVQAGKAARQAELEARQVSSQAELKKSLQQQKITTGKERQIGSLKSLFGAGEISTQSDVFQFNALQTQQQAEQQMTLVEAGYQQDLAKEQELYQQARDIRSAGAISGLTGTLNLATQMTAQVFGMPEGWAQKLGESVGINYARGTGTDRISMKDYQKYQQQKDRQMKNY